MWHEKKTVVRIKMVELMWTYRCVATELYNFTYSNSHHAYVYVWNHFSIDETKYLFSSITSIIAENWGDWTNDRQCIKGFASTSSTPLNNCVILPYPIYQFHVSINRRQRKKTVLSHLGKICYCSVMLFIHILQSSKVKFTKNSLFHPLV